MVQGDDVIVLTASGTAAFEAALLGCVPATGSMLSLVSGRFGERWSQLGARFGFAVTELHTQPGTEFDVGALESALESLPELRAVSLVHSETSTGMLHDVEMLAAVVRRVRPDALIITDAVTSLAAAELRPREWGLDAVVSGSQKGLMTPPGLSFVWLSERAWASDESLLPSAYLDIRRERSKQQSGQTAWTPATTLVAGLAVALEIILEQGVELRWQQKAALNDALLAAGEAAGLRRFAARPSPALAALATPDGVNAATVVQALRQAGVYIAGGEGELRARLLRPSLLGWAGREELLLLAGALENGMRAVGVAVTQGVAEAAAAASYDAAVVNGAQR